MGLRSGDCGGQSRTVRNPWFSLLLRQSNLWGVLGIIILLQYEPFSTKIEPGSWWSQFCEGVWKQPQTWILPAPHFTVAWNTGIILSTVCLLTYTLLGSTPIDHSDSSVNGTFIIHCEIQVFLSPPQVFVLVSLMRSCSETAPCPLRHYKTG